MCASIPTMAGWSLISIFISWRKRTQKRSMLSRRLQTSHPSPQSIWVTGMASEASGCAMRDPKGPSKSQNMLFKFDSPLQVMLIESLHMARWCKPGQTCGINFFGSLNGPPAQCTCFLQQGRMNRKTCWDCWDVFKTTNQHIGFQQIHQIHLISIQQLVHQFIQTSTNL